MARWRPLAKVDQGLFAILMHLGMSADIGRIGADVHFLFGELMVPNATTGMARERFGTTHLQGRHP